MQYLSSRKYRMQHLSSRKYHMQYPTFWKSGIKKALSLCPGEPHIPSDAAMLRMHSCALEFPSRSWASCSEGQARDRAMRQDARISCGFHDAARAILLRSGKTLSLTIMWALRQVDARAGPGARRGGARARSRARPGRGRQRRRRGGRGGAAS